MHVKRRRQNRTHSRSSIICHRLRTRSQKPSHRRMRCSTTTNPMRSRKYLCSRMVVQASTSTNTLVATNIETSLPNLTTTTHRSKVIGEIVGRHHDSHQISPLPLDLHHRKVTSLSPRLPSVETCTVFRTLLNNIVLRATCRRRPSKLRNSRRISHQWNRAQARLAGPIMVARPATIYRSRRLQPPTLAPTPALTMAAHCASRPRRNSRSISGKGIAKTPILQALRVWAAA